MEDARIACSLGYNVDIIDYECSCIRSDRKYDLFMGGISNIDMLQEGLLNEGCVRIARLAGSEPGFNDRKELERRQQMAVRRKARIAAERIGDEVLRNAIGWFNAAFLIGNELTWQTYRSANAFVPPVHYIPNGGLLFDLIEDGRRSAKKFLFFASSGQVHKGLDLLLEVFSTACRDCELFVCSLFRQEQEFCQAYEQELFHTPNIHAIGFVDVQGEQFLDVAGQCGYVIIPSCAEGKIGSAMYPMSVGCVPILSRECGFDEDEAILLRDCSLGCLEATVREYAAKDDEWLRRKSRYYHDIVKERYSREAFTEKFTSALKEVLRNAE